MYTVHYIQLIYHCPNMRSLLSNCYMYSPFSMPTSIICLLVKHVHSLYLLVSGITNVMSSWTQSGEVYLGTGVSIYCSDSIGRCGSSGSLMMFVCN